MGRIVTEGELEELSSGYYYNTGIYFGKELSKKEYEQLEKELDKINIVRDTYTINASYDVGGYDYWSEVEDDLNYIDFVVSSKGEVDKEQLESDLYDLYTDYSIYNELDRFNILWAD